MPLWNAKLTDIVLTAGDPGEATDHWARLLGGEAAGEQILLSGGTRIDVREGGQEGLAEIGLEASPELVAAAGDATELSDPDGWRLRLDAVAEVEPHTDPLPGPTLSHCTLESPAPRTQRDWYEQTGFLLSDELGDIFCWLRPNPIHHSVAFCRAQRPGIHHLAVELPDSASFIAAIDNVVAQGAVLEFGPGRHMIGGNLFAYLRDRYGLRWELCAEMNRFDPSREPGRLTPSDRSRSVNVFGPVPPASFLEQSGGPQTGGS